MDIVNFIKNGGNALIAGLLRSLVLSIVLFRTIYHIAARTFYAQQDTRAPLYISLFISHNIILALIFTNIFHWGVYGLAWARNHLCQLLRW